jgi:hypothetical protein
VRRLRAQLDREGDPSRAEISTEMEPGQSRHLEIAVAEDGALALEWR